MTSPTLQPAGAAVRLGLRENLAQFALLVIAALTFVSGVVAATRMAETLPARARPTPRADGESSMTMPSSQHALAEMRRPE